MNRQMKYGRRLWPAVVQIALLGLVAATDCSVQPQMVNVWKDPSYSAGSMDNVLVVALRKDPVRRRVWEDAFAGELGARGVSATPSYRQFPEAPPDTQEVTSAIRRNGYNAVIVSIRLPDDTTSTYVPGVVRSQPVMLQDYRGIFYNYWRDVQEPGHMEIDEVTQVRTDVWSAGGSGHLVWSGTLRTYDSVTSQTVVTAVSKDIVPAMARQRLVPRRK